MIVKDRIDDVLPKSRKNGGIVALGIFSFLLAIPTLLYMIVAKKESKNKEAYY
jgi:hypothetical protein